MRLPVYLLLFASMCGLLAAQQPADPSTQLKEKFVAILKQQVFAVMNDTLGHDDPKPSAEQIAMQVDSIMTETKTEYASVLDLSEAEASRLLATGPNDQENLEEVRRDIELWKKVNYPLPALLEKMQNRVTAGVIKGGLELELVKRISEFHLREIGLLPKPVQTPDTAPPATPK